MQTLIKHFFTGVKALAQVCGILIVVMAGFMWFVFGWFGGVMVWDLYSPWAGGAIIFLWVATMGALWDD